MRMIIYIIFNLVKNYLFENKTRFFFKTILNYYPIIYFFVCYTVKNEKNKQSI